MRSEVAEVPVARRMLRVRVSRWASRARKLYVYAGVPSATVRLEAFVWASGERTAAVTGLSGTGEFSSV